MSTSWQNRKQSDDALGARWHRPSFRCVKQPSKVRLSERPLNLPASLCCVSMALARFWRSMRKPLLLVGGDSPLGRSVAEIVPFPSHRAFTRRWNRLWAMAADGTYASVETKLPLRGGGRLTARIAMRLFRFEQEEFASIAITETTQARADAKRVQLDESRARAIAQHQSELTVVLNEDRRVVYASAALEPITGEQAFDVLGSPFEFILDQPSRIEFRRAVDRILREQPGDRQHPPLLLRMRAALAGTAAASHALSPIGSMILVCAVWCLRRGTWARRNARKREGCVFASDFWNWRYSPSLTSRMHCRPFCARQPKCSMSARSVFGVCRPTANRCAANHCSTAPGSFPARLGGARTDRDALSRLLRAAD